MKHANKEEGVEMTDKGKTLIAILASHDSIVKNNELARVFEELYEKEKNENKLGKFHFVFTGGTYRRLMLGKGENITKRPDGVLKPAEQHENIFPIRGLCDLWNVKRLMNAESVRSWFRDEAERDIRRNPQKIPLEIIWGTPGTCGPRPVAKREAYENLQNLPHGTKFPNHLKDKTRYDADKKQLIMREDVNEREKEELLKLSTDGQYNDAVKKLFSKTSKGDLTSEYYVRLPVRERHDEEFWRQFEKQTIALIAHDEMKTRMIDFAIQYENELSKFKRILATGTTGQEVMNACRRLKDKVERCLSGPKGGDIEIATEILFGECHIVVFFIDPLHPHPHIDDIRVVFSACMAEIENNDVRMLTNEVQAREWIEEAVRRRNKAEFKNVAASE